jgi:hypothetical protein
LSDLEKQVYHQRALESQHQQPEQHLRQRDGLDERELARASPYGIGSSAYPLNESRVKDATKVLGMSMVGADDVDQMCQLGKHENHRKAIGDVSFEC